MYKHTWTVYRARKCQIHDEKWNPCLTQVKGHWTWCVFGWLILRHFHHLLLKVISRRSVNAASVSVITHTLWNFLTLHAKACFSHKAIHKMKENMKLSSKRSSNHMRNMTFYWFIKDDLWLSPSLIIIAVFIVNNKILMCYFIFCIL